MHELNFTDRSFDKDSDGIYSMSIQANTNGLTYCISDDIMGSYVLFRKHRFNHVHLIGDLIEKITEVFETDELINMQFHAVRFMGFTQQTTLVPDAYFDRNKMRDYLMFSHAGDIDQELFYNHISPPGIHNVFALPHDLVSKITSHFKKIEFMNQTTPFLRHIANQKDAFNNPAVFVSLNRGFFDIACTGDGKLKLYNTFQYANDSDLLYYIVFVYNQLGFDTLKIPLYFSGEMSSKQSYYDLLYQYIPGTKYDEAVGIPSLAPGLRQLSTTRFLNLLNLQMCGSLAEHTGDEK
jgi:hypothetical protein